MRVCAVVASILQIIDVNIEQGWRDHRTLGLGSQPGRMHMKTAPFGFTCWVRSVRKLFTHSQKAVETFIYANCVFLIALHGLQGHSRPWLARYISNYIYIHHFINKFINKILPVLELSVTSYHFGISFDSGSVFDTDMLIALVFRSSNFSSRDNFSITFAIWGSTYIWLKPFFNICWMIHPSELE